LLLLLLLPLLPLLLPPPPPPLPPPQINSQRLSMHLATTANKLVSAEPILSNKILGGENSVARLRCPRCRMRIQPAIVSNLE
jgi:hypothetical protein